MTPTAQTSAAVVALCPLSTSGATQFDPSAAASREARGCDFFGAAAKLKKAIPQIDDADIKAMQEDFPMRCFDDEILKEPNVYRTYEAITHNGEAIKALINEKCGDGIMSAIDFYLDVGTTTGKHGEKRVVITFNGKFLPFIEQKSIDNTAASPRD